MVVNEAKALKVPVICPDFPSVFESVEEGLDGYVVPIDRMPAKIAEMMETPLKIEKCRINNELILQQVYKLFEA